jgi:hypothetical protein
LLSLDQGREAGGRNCRVIDHRSGIRPEMCDVGKMTAPFPTAANFGCMYFLNDAGPGYF